MHPTLATTHMHDDGMFSFNRFSAPRKNPTYNSFNLIFFIFLYISKYDSCIMDIVKEEKKQDYPF